MAGGGMSGEPIPAGDIRFYDGYKPALDAGDYTLTATQKTDSTDTAHPLSETTTATQFFSVTAPRFAMDPAEIQSIYPPANATGPFDRKLPNVVLKERALPWERELADQFPHPPNPNAPAYPWVALLVFAEADIIPPSGNAASSAPNPTLVGTYKVSDFLKPTDPSILLPNLTAQREDEKNCQAIDISTDTFTRLTPRLEDLPYLAHVRQVNVESKAGTYADGSGWFSVVIANRFPRAVDEAGDKFIAHLVSLEGLASYLVDKPTWPDGVTTVRLASLTSWAFTSQPDGADFTALMKNLYAGQSGGGDGLRLRLPLTGATQPLGTAAGDAAAALSQGYAPLHYETRVGDQTYGWYHGPLVPHPLARLTAGTAFASAAAATIYDPGSGTFDLSYAACWATGRLMALRDRAYATAQQRVRTALRRAVNLVRERGSMGKLGNVEVGRPRVADAAPESKVVGNAFAGWLATEASASVPRPGRRAAAPSARFKNGKPLQPAVEELRALYAASDIHAMIEKHVMQAATQSGPTDTVVGWLAQLRLLEGVPFVHLVPDARMLPPESIRFFYVDPNALDALCDGAQSIGIQTSRDAAQHQLARGAVMKAAIARNQARRRTRLAQRPAGNGSGADPVAGFLLRSAAVSGWPGLEVQAFLDVQGTQEIKALRLDHLASDVLIGLYPQVPAQIAIEEPKEGLAFGAEDEWKVALRYVAGDSVGQQIPNVSVTLDESYRPNDVLRVDAWQKYLIGLSALSSNASIWGPAGFALQMVSSPEQMIFDNGGAA
jgi:hypothetical protein